MTGDGRLVEPEIRLDLATAALAVGQEVEDRQAGGVGEGVKELGLTLVAGQVDREVLVSVQRLASRLIMHYPAYTHIRRKPLPRQVPRIDSVACRSHIQTGLARRGHRRGPKSHF